MNILFLGGAKRVSMARMFIEAGQRLGHEVNIISYELEDDVPIACVGRVVKGLKWSDSGLMDDLEELVKRERITVMVAFVDAAVEVAARFCATHSDVWSPVSDEKLCAVMFDKTLSAQLFEALNLPVPATMSIGDGCFPKIAKPRLGSASKGIKVIMEAADETGVAAHSDDYLIQEYIAKSEEYTVDCYVSRHGEIVCAVPRRRLEVAGGEVTRSVTVDIPELNSLSLSVLERTGLRGAVTLQFLHDVTGDRWLLMEINPRLGGGAVCAVHAGANLPEYIIRESLGLAIEPPVWDSGVEITRYMQEVVFRKS